MSEPITVAQRNSAEHRPSAAAPEYAPAEPRPSDHTAVSVSCEPEPPAEEKALLVTVPPPAAEDGDRPPSYHQVTGQQAPPPAYKLLFSEIRRAKRDWTGSWQLFREAVETVAVVFGSIVGVLAFFGIQLALPISMVVIGIKHNQDCPAVSWLGVWMAIAGVLSLYRSLPVCVFIGVLRMGPSGGSYGADDGDIWAPLLMFHIAWLFVGCFLVFRVFLPDFTDVSSAGYCDYGLYVTALVSVLVTLLMVAVCLVAVCWWLCASCRLPAAEEVVPAGSEQQAETTAAAAGTAASARP